MSDSESVTLPAPVTLPWHAGALEQLRHAWRARRMPHALLLQGADGLGKRALAAWLTGAVLCERSQDSELDRCGTCGTCALVAAATHPDLYWVAPEEGKQQISIDQVRAACERLTRTSFRQGYKVAIVEPAHQMTVSATNSLLKTLEEPAARSLLVLITSRPGSLLPTVRSRCQKITIAGPDEQSALEWLQRQSGRQISRDLLAFAGGAPLRALEYADSFAALNEQMVKGLGNLLSGRADVTQVAAEWEKDGLPERLVWLDLWLTSLARQALAGSAERFTFPSGPAHLPSPPAALNISGVYRMVDRARELKAQLAKTALQRELAIEGWLIALLQLFAPAPTPAR